MLESLAVAMRHSPRYQKKVYDRRTANERIKSGLLYTANEFNKAFSRPPPALASTGVDQTPPPSKLRRPTLPTTIVVEDGDDDKQEEAAIPKFIPNEIVAMVAADSTPAQPKLLFAKIVKINSIEGTALLQELAEELPGVYRVRLGHSSRWEEAFEALISGVDFHYSIQDKGYIIRTPIEDIIKQVEK